MMQTACSVQGMELRRLRYRLQRLGILELEAWLSRLEPALEREDEAVMRATQQLMEMPTPQLLSMMHAEIPLPEVLRPWLGEKSA
jgi:antitoxin CptB